MKSKKLPVLIAVLLVLSLAANGYLFYSQHQQQRQTAALMEQHTAQLDEFANEQAAQLETLTADHAAEVERLNQEHAAEIAELKAAYDAEIANQQESKPESPANAEPTAATTTPAQSSKPTAEAPPKQNNGHEPPMENDPDMNMPEKPGYVYIPGFGYIESTGDINNAEPGDSKNDPSIWDLDPDDIIPGSY